MFKVILISVISGVLSGMGIGGGGIFILLSTIFNLFPRKEALFYNLLMFVATGISASISNLKNKKINKSLFKKVIVFLCIGSISGIVISKNIDEEKITFSFYIFMLIIGSYEIFSSLKKLLKSNNKE